MRVRLFSILVLICIVLLSIAEIQAAEERMTQSSTFGINVANNAPASNPIYVYGDGTVSEYIPPNSGTSLGPFDSGPYYSVVMYTNTPGSHTFTFTGPIEGGSVYSESITTSSGSATFHSGYLVGNSSASITYNGL